MLRSIFGTLAVTASAVTALSLSGTATSAGAPVMCDGRIATIVNTNPAIVHGTEGPDVIVTTAESAVDALGGNDVVCGSDGQDRITGGPGDDRIFGGGGRDVLYGDSGDDVVAAGTTLRDDTARSGNVGAEHLEGGSGSDHLYGTAGPDSLTGGSGEDWLWGGLGDDQLLSGNFDLRGPVVAGASGVDVDLRTGPVVGHVYGVATGQGHDRLYNIKKAGTEVRTGSGDDTVTGTSFDDVITTSTGDDVIRAGNGDDVVKAGTGRDRIHGDKGRDRCSGGEQVESCEHVS